MSDRIETLIVGAGPTGLAAAWRLDQLGHSDWRIYEQESEVGGLARSVVDEHGFTWDLGGHVQFSHYEAFDALMVDLLGEHGWLDHERHASIKLRDRYIPYPFQLNLQHLADSDRLACLQGLDARPPSAGPSANFDEWIERQFGRGIADIFMRPYNLKVWGYPLADLSADWMADRVAVVGNDPVADADKGTSWGPNRRFRFPRRGGTGAVWRALASRLSSPRADRVRLRRSLERLDTARHTAHFAGGEAVCYERLLSTAPLDVLVRRSDLAEPLGPATAALRHSSTHVIGVGLHGRARSPFLGKSWIYFPGDDCPFHRTTVFSSYSPAHVPDPDRFSSLLVEITDTSHRPCDVDRALSETVDGLLRTELIADRHEIHHLWHCRLSHGYPTPTIGRDASLTLILPAFEARDVFSRGRFGAWKYEVSNQDHCVAQGIETVDRWYLGKPEVTLRQPDFVNARRASAAKDPLS